MLSKETINILKMKLNFDDLEKNRMTISMMDEISKMRDIAAVQTDEQRKAVLSKRIDIFERYFLWSNDIWYKGNAAQNLFLMLETMNLKVTIENEDLKKQVEKLKAELEWNK